ncbi:DinB family protein [Flavobacterium suncheonense]|uniref:Damage-inducible protein DinB n=1 Tax=Flavobacterium suncheonense GH29-5 = DSM 17707 TaxID=1121899 RepID=A0A0A2MCP3_9FLAO|nr:DinB family protein [Flavobacterium suncheonense]KGO90044.1 damage-inducible protein DinB [Flavobacterium suncheonense GH29-5 = DSM 17707]
MKPTVLQKNEYASFYQPYLDALEENINLIDELEISLYNTIHFIQDIPMDKFDYRYAEGKWTIKEIIQHIIDAERVFSYRALRFSRNDKTELPGYDENLFADTVNPMANQRHLKDLLTELSAVRHSTICLFKSFTPEDFLKIGVASEREMSVRAIGFIIIGHQNHHMRVFKQRYLD